MEEMYLYLTDSRKTTDLGLIGLGINPWNAVSEMRFVQTLRNKETLIYDYLQIIFCFDVGIKIDIETLREICIRIG